MTGGCPYKMRLGRGECVTTWGEDGPLQAKERVLRRKQLQTSNNLIVSFKFLILCYGRPLKLKKLVKRSLGHSV